MSYQSEPTSAQYAAFTIDQHLALAAGSAADAQGYDPASAIDLARAQLHVAWATVLLLRDAAKK